MIQPGQARVNKRAAHSFSSRWRCSGTAGPRTGCGLLVPGGGELTSFLLGPPPQGSPFPRQARFQGRTSSHTLARSAQVVVDGGAAAQHPSQLRSRRRA